MSLTLRLTIDTCLIRCLHRVFSTIQNCRQRIKPIRILIDDETFIPILAVIVLYLQYVSQPLFLYIYML
jgi:hypothetical protein